MNTHPAQRPAGKPKSEFSKADPAIEIESGVPIPGRILPPEQWSKTALKKVPPGVLNWAELFGRTAPVILDLGCGNGRFSLGSAVQRPDCDHFASDVLPVVIRYATRRGNQRGLTNLRFAVIGARELLADHVPPHSVSEIHCYHPQPFVQSKFHRAQRTAGGPRLISADFLSLVRKALVPNGQLFLQTDNYDYWQQMLQLVRTEFDFHVRDSAWPETPEGRTRREILARKQGLPIFRGSGRLRLE